MLTAEHQAFLRTPLKLPECRAAFANIGIMRIAFVLAPALCAAVATSASAAVRPSVVPLDGVRASYLWTTARHAPNGDSDGSAAVILRGAPQGAMQVDVAIDGYDELYQAKSLADGTLDFVALKHEAPAPQLARLNQVARIAGAANQSEKVGDSWRVDLSEPVPGGTIDVQVVVHVTGADGDALVLEADGQAKGTIALPQPEVDPADAPAARAVIRADRADIRRAVRRKA